ncbi:MAG: OPT/YSL family transporter [Alphaproteobacteria bacterium]|nr:OPT/YSL family transporter [Alphaproteobacteria bacterium]MBV9150954.1 OPT/YSL family transporter [Alphaproteobacteria bacterium]
MTDLSRAAAVPATPPPRPGAEAQHPSTFAPATFVLLVVLCVFGAVIGVQLILQLGITPNTSIIGALVAMLLARIPGAIFARYRSIHVQNLAQSAISAATFGAANSLLLPIGVPFLLGRPDLILPMLIGAALSMLLDGYLLYRMFDTRVFPAAGTWPPGVAAAEAIRAGDAGGKRAAMLGVGLVVGIVGAWFTIPMSAFGVAFIGNVWALTMFGIGLLIRGYAMPVAGIDIAKLYVPHGAMVGAGLVALIQVALLIARRGGEQQAAAGTDDRQMRRALGLGSIGFIAIALLIALMGGLIGDLSPAMLIGFVVYAAFAAFVHELIVGISAMHAGWFPAFAVALITLIIGILLGFPPIALGLLVGFSASTGPAFADMGYDLRAGYLLRGEGANPAFELAGRRQQLYAAMLAFLIAIPTVWFAHPSYFAQGLVPPVVKVYVATIQAGAAGDVAMALAIWAVPAALIQWLGGPSRQLGILLATGLLIPNPMAGWAVLVGIAIRTIVLRWKGKEASGPMEVLAAGFIGGDALYGFFDSVIKAVPKVK